MMFNSHTKVNGNNSMPNSLIKPTFGVKTGGNPFENLRANLGNVVQSLGENTKDVGTTLQGHFNRFLNNPVFSTTKNAQNLTETVPDQKTAEMEAPMFSLKDNRENALSAPVLEKPSQDESAVVSPLSLNTETTPTNQLSVSAMGGKLVKKHRKTRKHKISKRKEHTKHIKTRKTRRHKRRQSKH
jgi:hypothetical protein